MYIHTYVIFPFKQPIIDKHALLEHEEKNKEQPTVCVLSCWLSCEMNFEIPHDTIVSRGCERQFAQK